MAEIKHEIKEHFVILSENDKGWKKELNLVSWNDAPPKYAIRDWSNNHEKMGKGITLNADEMKRLYDALKKIMED